jgi:pimeloyl-ACP methyl ester carboxylesterase
MKIYHLPLCCLLVLLQLSCINEHKPANDHIKISDNGVNIAYTDTGKGDTALLLVHGWGLNKGYWTSQVNYFSKRFRVIAIDLPGFGESGKNRTVWNTEAYGRDVDSVIAQLHLNKVILVGHSMAGNIILQAAVNANGHVIGLVGVDNFKGVGHAETEQDKKDYAIAIDQMRHHFKPFATQYFNQALFYKTTADTIKKRILGDITKADSVIATDCMVEDNFDEVKQLQAVKKKLYLINSDYTPTDTTGLVSNHILCQIYYIHATGHFPMVEKPQEFNTALTDIIKQL